jgi:hypothetical protein
VPRFAVNGDDVIIGLFGFLGVHRAVSERLAGWRL